MNNTASEGSRMTINYESEAQRL